MNSSLSAAEFRQNSRVWGAVQQSVPDAIGLPFSAGNLPAPLSEFKEMAGTICRNLPAFCRCANAPRRHGMTPLLRGLPCCRGWSGVGTPVPSLVRNPSSKGSAYLSANPRQPLPRKAGSPANAAHAHLLLRFSAERGCALLKFPVERDCAAGSKFAAPVVEAAAGEPIHARRAAASHGGPQRVASRALANSPALSPPRTSWSRGGPLPHPARTTPASPKGKGQ